MRPIHQRAAIRGSVLTRLQHFFSRAVLTGGHRNMTECHKEQGFTLIELIVVIVILGILAVTAAPKFMNLTSDANSAVVKGLARAIRSASQTIYAKSKVNRNGANPSYVCATDECIGEEYLSAEEQQKKTQDLYNAAEARNGWIGVTDKGYPISGYSGGNNSIKATIVGAIDLGVAMKGEDYINMMADEKNGYKGETSANKTDWIVYRVDSTGGTVLGGLVFVPKSAPADAKKASHYGKDKKDSAESGKSTCGVYYRSGTIHELGENVSGRFTETTPIIKVFTKGC